MSNIRSFKELRVWKAAMDLACTVHEISKRFPPEERYSLTDQIRRSSRSVAANIAEGWRKRRYEAAFVSKMSDAEAEMAETQVWVEFCLRFGYIDAGCAESIDRDCEAVIAQIVAMIARPEAWTIRPGKGAETRRT